MNTMDNSSDLRPRVQIPLGAKYHGLSIDGEFVNAIPQDHMGAPEAFLTQYGHLDNYLPAEASHAYWNHYNTDNSGWVYQCSECGYLSMSKNCRTSAYRKTTCNECSSTSWKRVWPADSLITVDRDKREEVALDIEDVTADDVPNHPTHLGRILNQVKNHVTKSEMFERVADAVESARRTGDVRY
jgi:hypothetical protein